MLWLTRAMTVALLLFPVSGQGEEPPQPVVSVAGLWFGEGHQPELKMDMVWLVQRNEDGTFVFDARRYHECRMIFRQVEKGRWRQVGLQYFTTTESIEGTPFHAEDEYLIEQITPKDMTYRHLKSNTKFEARRISPTVGFPLPSRCSI